MLHQKKYQGLLRDKRKWQTASYTARLAISCAALTLLMGFAGCSEIKINYRLTFEVEVDGTVYAGSGVLSTTWYYQNYTLEKNSWGAQMVGEAIAIDLGPRGTLFMLLTGPKTKPIGGGEMYYDNNPEGLELRAFPLRHNGPMTPDDLDEISERRDVREIPISYLPMFVLFRDIYDPASVRLVDPGNLGETVGPSARLLHATIQITTDPPTDHICARLPWLRDINTKIAGYRASNHKLAETLSALNFQERRTCQ